MLKSLINSKKPLPIKLHNIVLLQLGYITIRDRLGPNLRLLIQEILERIFRLEFILCDEIIEVDELDGDEVLVGGEPCNLLAGFLHVALEVELEFEARDGFEAVFGHFKGVEGVADFADDGVAPVHEGDFFVLGEGLCVGLLEEDRGAEHDLFVAKVVFGVLGLVLGEDALACADDGDGDAAVVVDGGVTRGGGLDVFLVRGPEGEPILVDDVLGGTLLQDELAKSRNDGTSATNTADSRHARVVPASDDASVNNLSQLALGQYSLDEVQACETPVVYLAELQVLDEPLILCVAIIVLGSTQSMCNTLKSIDDGAAEVVGGVDLPLVASAVMGLGVASVDDGVAHGLVGIID